VRIVLDTNVLVSGLLSPFGPPGQIVALIAEGDLQPCIDSRIILEYREVLLRPAFGFDPADVQTLIDYLENESFEAVARPLAAGLPHPADEVFLSVAMASSAKALITGNLRHFPSDRREGVLVISPAGFLGRYRDLMDPD
jgi:putative PIN family toxin of toxin-antitoxin system